MEYIIEPDELWDIVEKLPDRYSFIIKQVYIHNLSLRDIGWMLGISGSRVNELRHKAIIKLKNPENIKKINKIVSVVVNENKELYQLLDLGRIC